MKRTFILLFISVMTGKLAIAQGVGMNCQYFPGLQVGFVSVKMERHPTFGSIKYRYGAGLPLLMIDRISNHWYVNVDMSALYYSATQTNKGNDDRIKISKAEGGVFSSRLGYLFGDGDQFRMGGNLNFGWSTSNFDSLRSPYKQAFERNYINYGLGLIAYKKFGKFRTAAKIGYELYRKKNLLDKSSGFYFEGTIGYSFYQKYGLSVMPCFYSKKFTYTSIGGSATDGTTAKIRSFVLRFGITKFF